MSRLVRVANWSGEQRANVVFVHGVGGHPYDTWRSSPDGKTFWPRWLAEDVKGLSVFTLGYISPATNWLGTAMPLLDEAVSVSRLLSSEPALASGPIAFVCHSLGGLIIKQVLRDAKEREQSDPALASLLRRTRLVIFLGTPHTGTGKATLLERVNFLTWGSDSAKDLVANKPELRSLNVGYRTLAEERKELSHLVFYEMVDTFFGRIVDPGSSDPGLPNCRPIPIREDHVRICKPLVRDALLYREVKGAISQIAPEPRAAGKLKVHDLPAFKASWSLAPLAPKFARVSVGVMIVLGLCYLVVSVVDFVRQSETRATLANEALRRALAHQRLEQFVALGTPPYDSIFIIDYSVGGGPMEHPHFARAFPAFVNSGDIGRISVSITKEITLAGIISSDGRIRNDPQHTTALADSDAGNSTAPTAIEDDLWFTEEIAPVAAVGAKLNALISGISMRRLLSEFSAISTESAGRIELDFPNEVERDVVIDGLMKVRAYYKLYVRRRADNFDGCASVIFIPITLAVNPPGTRGKMIIDLYLSLRSISIDECEKPPF